MKEQSKQQKIPYEPLFFIHTGTIGGIKKDEKKKYEWMPIDVLKPSAINSHNPIFYLLFHNPPIYNWLREIDCKERELLNQYILRSSNKSFVSAKFMDQMFFNSVNHYCQRWQIVKLCFSSKVLITDIMPKDKDCNHLLKKQKNCQSFYYQPSGNVSCNKIYCGICKKWVEVKAIINQLPKYLILQQKGLNQQKIEINKTINEKKSSNYELIMFFTKDKVYIKSLMNVWFEVYLSINKTSVIGYHKLPLKEGIVYQYSLNGLNNNLNLSLRPSQPIFLINKQKIKSQIIQQEEFFIKEQKVFKQNFVKIVEQNKDKLNLKELKAKKSHIALHKEENPKYQAAMEKIYEKQKVKDEYEQTYDLGKLKKKKIKKHYITPDFNKLQQELKTRKAYQQQEDQYQRDYQRGKEKGRRGKRFENKGNFRNKESHFKNNSYSNKHQKP